jgi:hypothetical protein
VGGHCGLPLFDHLIRPLQQRRRDRQAEGLGGLEVDDEFELRENGADIQDMQEARGHAGITTTTMYAHLTTRRQREKLAEYLKLRRRT